MAPVGTATQTSLGRLSADLLLQDQLYLFSQGRMWLYRQSTLVSELAIPSMNEFRKRVLRYGVRELFNESEIENYI